MADVIAIRMWLMLLPLVILYCNNFALAGVIAKLTVTDLIAKPYGRCCCHIIVVDAVTGGSHLSHTAVKMDSHLAQIFVAKFLCIIKLIIIIA